MRATYTIQLDDFEDLSPADQHDVYLDGMMAVVRANVAYLLAHPAAPLLYDSGVRFGMSEDERNGVGNTWPNIPAILRTRIAHCMGLSCWRVAELLVRGVQARPCVKEFREERPGVGVVQEFHACVCFPDGRIEDPSARLGMPT